MEEDRIINAKNRVFDHDGMGLGKNNPISLHTSNNYVYRATGYSQIEDIIKTGYIRPKAGKVKGGHKNEVFWSRGSEKLFYSDKRPVLVVSKNAVVDGQMVALSIDDLEAIMIFDEKQNKYVDNLSYYKELYEENRERRL